MFYSKTGRKCTIKGNKLCSKFEVVELSVKFLFEKLLPIHLIANSANVTLFEDHLTVLNHVRD